MIDVIKIQQPPLPNERDTEFTVRLAEALFSLYGCRGTALEAAHLVRTVAEESATHASFDSPEWEEGLRLRLVAHHVFPAGCISNGVATCICVDFLHKWMLAYYLRSVFAKYYADVTGLDFLSLWPPTKDRVLWRIEVALMSIDDEPNAWMELSHYRALTDMAMRRMKLRLDETPIHRHGYLTFEVLDEWLLRWMPGELKKTPLSSAVGNTPIRTKS